VITDIKTQTLSVAKDKAEVLITFKTDKMSNTNLEINGKIIKDENYNQSHSMILDDLVPAQTYKFKVSSQTEGGALAASADQTLSTPPVPEEQTILQIILESLKKSFSFLSKWLSK